MTVTVDTNTFEFAHSKSPRGTGFWFFFGPGGEEFSFSGSFAQAKKAAVKWAKENGFNQVEVGS
jgi:hypothetical protein